MQLILWLNIPPSTMEMFNFIRIKGYGGKGETMVRLKSIVYFHLHNVCECAKLIFF